MADHIPPGYKKKEIGIIIPEDWEVKRVKDLFDIISGPFGSAIKKEILSKKGIPIYSAQNVINKDFTRVNYINTRYFRSLKQFSIKREDMLITTRGSVGKVEIVPHKIKKGIIHSNLTILRPRIKEYNLKFLKYYMGYETFQNQIFNTLSQTTINALYSSNIKNLLIPLPLLPEQRAIAQILSDMDTLIENLDKLIEKKKNIKKGAMQELLTGKKRLPGFKGEWVRKKLIQITSMPVTDGPHLTPKFLNRGVPFLSVNNIVAYKINWSDLRYISKEDDIEFSKKCKPKKGDILLGKAATVGTVAIVESDIDFNIWSPLALIRIKEKYNKKFFYYYFQTLDINRQIKLLTNSSSQGNLGMREIEKLEFNVPPIPEQQAIAQILSDMDAEIEALEKKKKKYEMLKKGAMELLLTGKVRVTEKNGKIEVLK